MSNRSGSKYSAPTDANRRPFLLAASTADGITPVVLEADPVTHALVTSAGGGGGGAATIADGADVAEGATTDAAVTAGSAGTVSGKLRQISADISSIKTNTTGPLPVNMTQLNGVTASSGTGASDTGTQRTVLTNDYLSTVTAGSKPDNVTTGSIVVAGGAVVATVAPGMAGWSMGYYGTYATGASLTMEASYDGGSTYFSVRMLQVAQATLGYVLTIAIGTNNTSAFNADIPSGATHLRVRCSAWAAPTGTINVVLAQSIERYTSVPSAIQSVATIGSSMVPGTTAANLGKAEDAAHASGDTGVFSLGVRNDGAATVFTSNNGDYSPIATNGGGEVITVRNSATAAVTRVAASASSVSLLASNTARKGATIVNDSSVVMYIKEGTTASTTSYTVALAGSATPPYSIYELTDGYYGAIDAIWASATGNAQITERS